MNDLSFKLYLLFVISYFLRLPARISFLGDIRFDLILISFISISLILFRKDNIKTEIDNTGKILKILILYIIVTLPLVKWPGSVLHTNSLNFIKAVIFFYFTVSLIDTEKKLKVFMITFIACQSFRVFEPLYLHITTGYWGSRASMENWEFMNRLAGSPHDVVNPNGLAFVITSIIPFYHYLCLSSSYKFRILYFAALPIFLYALVLTASRTGFVALLIILTGIFLKTRRKLVFAIIVGIFAITAISYMGEIHKERYLSLVRDDVRGSTSTQRRIDGVISDFKVGLKRPIFGHGLGTSLEANANFGQRDIISHNLYLEILIELGIIGLIIFFFYIKSIIITLLSTVKNIKENLSNNNYLLNFVHAMQIWFWMNIFFSLASYGLSSYEWYLFGGLALVAKNLAEKSFNNNEMIKI